MKKIKSKTVRDYVMNDMVWKVDLPMFLKEISECSDYVPYAASFRILAQVLNVLTERAIEINDPALNIIMLNLGLYEEAHDKNADEVISKLRKLINDNKKRGGLGMIRDDAKIIITPTSVLLKEALTSEEINEINEAHIYRGYDCIPQLKYAGLVGRRNCKRSSNGKRMGRDWR